MKLSNGLKTLTQSATNTRQWTQAVIAALGSTRRLRCFRDSNASAGNPTVTGTEFLNVALTGNIEYNIDTGVITFLGLTSDSTVQVAADLSTGSSGFIISGGGHELTGTLGLTGSSKELKFSKNPTSTSGVALVDVTLRPPLSLPLPPVSDTVAPTVSIAASSTSFTTAASITLTATASDNVGVTKVEFYENGVLLSTDTSSPFTATKALTSADNGVINYTAKAFDAVGNTTTSTAVSVTVNIPAPVEPPGVVAVGGTFTDVQFQNTSSTTQTNVPVTFGQIFSAGTFPATNAAVDLRAPDNSLVTCQLDAKAFHPDGTVRHAILSAILPSLPGSATVTYSIVRRAAPPSGTPAVPSDFSGLNGTITLTETGIALSGPVTGSTYTADAAALLAAGTYETWLSGPICSEWILRVPLKTSGDVENTDLHARMYIRAYKGQAKAKIDFVIENTWAKPKSPQPTAAGASPWEDVSINEKIYRLNIKAGTTDMYTHSRNGRVLLRLQTGSYTTLLTGKTGLANDSTTYTATISFDGVSKNFSIVGSQAQTYADLIPIFAAQSDNLGALRTGDDKNGFEIISNTVGAASKVRVTNYGTLLPALKTTKLSSSTTYTAQLTINGSLVKNISFLGSTALHYGTLCSVLNAQLGGDATATPRAGTAPGIKFVSTATGLESDVVITNPGNLFKNGSNENVNDDFLRVYRPIDGDEVVHFQRTRLKKTYWWNTSAPTVHIMHNRTYWDSSYALPHYGPTLIGSTTEIDKDYATMQSTDFTTNCGVTNAYMPSTGYAPGIGLLPKWQATYAINQSVKAKAIMLEMADRSGLFPCYWRDYDTDKPINFNDWPYASVITSSSATRNPATGLYEKLPNAVFSPDIRPNQQIPDISHHPDFHFLPYLVTGDYYYMEGMLFHQAYTIIEYDPSTDYRDGKKGILHRGQLRAQAWSLRSLAHTLYAMPASHPNRSALVYILEQNRLWYETNAVNPSGYVHNVLGFMSTVNAVTYTSDRAIAPWMDDFFTSACGRLIELGFPEYMTILNHKSKSPVGRLTSGSAFCWQYASAYNLFLRDTATSPFYTNWGQVWNASANTAMKAATCGSVEMGTAMGEGQNEMDGYPTDPGGFPANMQPANAYIATYNCPGGDNAWLVFDNRKSKPNYNANPQFGIYPRN